MQTGYGEGICLCSECVHVHACFVKAPVLSVKSSLQQGFCFLCASVCVLRQPAERGKHLHTVAQAFCLYTWLLPSNASRPSRLWPPRGSRGALPLKGQLRLILHARQIFHSPAVHLRSTEPTSYFLSFIFVERHCAGLRERGVDLCAPVIALLLLSKKQTWPLTVCLKYTRIFWYE